MEHKSNATNSAPNRPAQGDPDDANLEAYGDWVTVDAEPAPFAESSPVTDVDTGDAHQEPDSRAAQDLTEAEEELLDQLTESERVVAAAPVAATVGPAAGDPHATTAALAKLERQLSSLNADLKAVGQQLAELRGRVDTVPEPAAAAAADMAASPAQTFAAEAGDDPLAITLEELERDPAVPWEAAASAPQAPPVDAAAVPREPQADASPAGRETPTEEEVDGNQQPPTTPVETVPGEAPPEAPAAGAEIGGQVREDVRAVLAYLDQLLDALPPEKVREFAASEHFATYKKLFTEFGLDD